MGSLTHMNSIWEQCQRAFDKLLSRSYLIVKGYDYVKAAVSEIKFTELADVP